MRLGGGVPASGMGNGHYWKFVGAGWRSICLGWIRRSWTRCDALRVCLARSFYDRDPHSI